MFSPPPNISLSRKIYIDVLYSGTLNWGIFMKINTTYNIICKCYTSSALSCILKEKFYKPAPLIFLFFHIFLLRWINSNKLKFELVHPHKNVKNKKQKNVLKSLQWSKTKYNTVYTKHFVLFRHLYFFFHVFIGEN